MAATYSNFIRPNLIEHIICKCSASHIKKPENAYKVPTGESKNWKTSTCIWNWSWQEFHKL